MTMRLVIAVCCIFLFGLPAVGQQQDEKKNLGSGQGELSESIRLVRQSVKNPGLALGASFTEKLINRQGDGAAIALLKIYDAEGLQNPENVRNYLPIIRAAFDAPAIVSVPENKKPEVTLFLLSYLQERIKDDVLKAGISEAAVYIKEKTLTGGDSSSSSIVKKADIASLIEDLHKHLWTGAEIVGESPIVWDFSLTVPMRGILEIGAPAQDALLDALNDTAIKDQAIFLLGGVGDERAIIPIMDAMVSETDMRTFPNAKRINRAANLALTNLTAANVIWPQGGGIMVEKCLSNSKECWSRWWNQNKRTFSVQNTTRSAKSYSNYPNYGVYRR